MSDLFSVSQGVYVADGVHLAFGIKMDRSMATAVYAGKRINGGALQTTVKILSKFTRVVALDSSEFIASKGDANVESRL